MTKTNCELTPAQTNAPVNVGDRLLLSCAGNWTEPVKETIRIVVEKPEDKYNLVPLQFVEGSSTHFKLIVTSYKVGEHKQKIVLDDGLNIVETNELNWAVESILEPNSKPELVPSKGPFVFSYPIWLWIAMGAVILLLALIALYSFWRKKQKKKLTEEMEEMKSSISPIGQLSKDIRKLQRQLSSVDDKIKSETLVADLDRDFRLYLVREFMVPAHKWSEGAILREFSKRYKILYKKHEGELKKVFKEIENAKKDQNRSNNRDDEDLIVITRRLAEKLYLAKLESKK